MEAGDGPKINPVSPVFGIFYPEDLHNSPRTLFDTVKDASKFANSPEAKLKGARIRKIKNAQEAQDFYERGCFAEYDSGDKGDWSKKAKPPSDPVVPFPSVSRVEMNKLKKVVETDNLEEFVVLVESNPRYLVNVAADNAAIVQEGFRFNALHISARSGSFFVTEHILKFITDTSFLTRLYGTNEEDASFRMRNILPSFLNTPDKGNSDTPLHLASKFGHVEVMRLLVSCKETIRDLENKSGERAMDVVCSRYDGKDKTERMKEMKKVLQSFFVALYRASDHSCPPRFIVSSHYPETTLSPSTLTSPFTSPISSPLLSSYILTALAGPFIEETLAKQFSNKWRNTNRDMSRRDFDKGIEKFSMSHNVWVGREMAVDDGVSFAESWPFSWKPIDVSTKEGLQVVEGHLRSLRIENENEKREEDDKLEDANEELNSDEPENESFTEGDSLASLTAKIGGLCIESPKRETEELNGVNEEEEEEEEDDDDEFHTPPTSPLPVFLNDSPCKMDSHLFEALSSVSSSSLTSFPFIRLFLSSMNKFDAESRNSWPSMDSPRFWRNSPVKSRMRHSLKPRSLLFNDM